MRRRGPGREVARRSAGSGVAVGWEVGREYTRHGDVAGSGVHQPWRWDHGALRHLACRGSGSSGSGGSGGINAAHVEWMHLVVQARWRRRALQDLRRLGRLTGINVSPMKLVVVEEARWALAAHLLALRGAPLAWVVLLAIRHVGKRDLFSGLRHAEEELLCAWRLGRLTVALHETHQKLPVTVDGSDILLLWARVMRAGQMMALREQVL